MPQPQTLYLVDGSAQVHRAYFAIRGLATSRGLPTNATYGFTTMLRKLLPGRGPRVDRHLASTSRAPRSVTRSTRTTRPTVPRCRTTWSSNCPTCVACARPFVCRSSRRRGSRPTTSSPPSPARPWSRASRWSWSAADKDLLQLVSDEILVLNPGREGRGSAALRRPRGRGQVRGASGARGRRAGAGGRRRRQRAGRAGHRRQGRTRPDPRLRRPGGASWRTRTESSARPIARASSPPRHALLSKRLVTLRADVPVPLELEELAPT